MHASSYSDAERMREKQLKKQQGEQADKSK